MAIKPILFNTGMVKAILDGRKTKTRRIVKAKGWNINGVPKWNTKKDEYWFTADNEHSATCIRIDPPYSPGDVLYVRETWRTETVWQGSYIGYEIAYKAGGKETFAGFPPMLPTEKGIWRPSIHMPKEAARIFLLVTDVRAERLQDITDADALKEGVPQDDDFPMNSVYCPVCHGKGLHGEHHPVSLGYMVVDCENCDTHVKRFSHLWNSTIKYDDAPRFGWNANPWVWVIEFERTENR